MRLGITLLFILGGFTSARAAGPDPYGGLTPEQYFCTQLAATRDIGLAQINTIAIMLDRLNSCVMPSQKAPPDFRKFRQGAQRKKEFLNYWGPHAVMIQDTTGLPASILLAQWAEESSWGSSNLYANSHNMSGHFCPARKAGEVYEYEFKLGNYTRTIVAQCGGQTSQKGSRALIFSNPVDSAWAHAYNLIQSPSRATTYRQIREEAAAATLEKPADWRKIIPELDRYYAPNQGYGRKLANHITSNKFDDWETVKVCD